MWIIGEEMRDEVWKVEEKKKTIVEEEERALRREWDVWEERERESSEKN